MKIIIISQSNYPYGAANSVNVLQMTNAFYEQGHHVILIAFKSELKSSDTIWQNVKQRFGLFDSKIDFRLLYWPFKRFLDPILGFYFTFNYILQHRKGTMVFTRF